MLLMVEKSIRGGIYHAMHRYAKVNNTYRKNYDKKIESSYFMYLDPNNLYGWAMSQKLPVNSFKWDENIHKFNEDFIKNYDEDSTKGYFLEVDDLHSDFQSLPEGKKIKKFNKLVCTR